MSRTYRRKKYPLPKWIYCDSMVSEKELHNYDAESIDIIRNSRWVYLFYKWVDVFIKPKSKEGKKRAAKYRSDAKTYDWFRPNGWFINTYYERANRRKTKNELRKFMLDTEYEPMIESKIKLGYWD